MAEVLSYPLGPLPWALATPEGLLQKTNKAVLATLLQKSIITAGKIPDNSTTIIDGMFIIQKLAGDKANSEVAMFVLSVDLKDGNMNQRIHVVFDIYKDTFIMNIERLAKGEELGLELKNITAAQIVSQGREFLGYAGNKSSLIQFPVEEWKPRGSNTEKHT